MTRGERARKRVLAILVQMLDVSDDSSSICEDKCWTYAAVGHVFGGLLQIPAETWSKTDGDPNVSWRVRIPRSLRDRGHAFFTAWLKARDLVEKVEHSTGEAVDPGEENATRTQEDDEEDLRGSWGSLSVRTDLAGLLRQAMGLADYPAEHLRETYGLKD